MSRLRTLSLLAVLAGFLLLAGWYFLDDPVARRAPGPSAPESPATSLSSATPASAPASEAPAQWPLDAPRTVVGKISDAQGAPVRGASVRLERAGRLVAQARADARGGYRLERVPPTELTLRVRAPGYRAFTERRPQLARGKQVRWDAALEAIPGLRGRVTAAGAPVAEAWISLHADDSYRPVAHTVSDAGGRYFLAWPDVGAVGVVARHNQHGRVVQPVDGPGELDIELPAGGYVEGRVVDPSGAPVESFSVTASPLMRGRGGPPAQSFSSAEGRFRLGPLAAGRLRIWAAAEGYQPAETRTLELESGQTLFDVVLTLRTSVAVSGRVTDARTGRPVEGAQVIPAEWRAGALAEAVGTYTDDDGRYRLDALPGSRTSIRVRAEGYRSVLVGGIEGRPGEEIRRDFTLTPQPAGERPQSELTGIGAVLRGHRQGVLIGQVIDGGPAADVLRPGDLVVGVNGDRVGGWNMSKVAQAIRGEEGSEVELMVRRGGRGDPEPVVLTRGRVTVPDRHHRPRRN